MPVRPRSSRAASRLRSTWSVEPLEGRVMLSATLVKDIFASTEGLPGAHYKADFNGTDVIFASKQGLYRTDGTPAGTTLLRDGLGNSFGYPPHFARLGGSVYFRARTTEFGSPVGLWKTDGTPGGTTRVTEVAAEYENLTNSGGRLYFGAMAGTMAQLWTSDGTASGTTLLKSFTDDNVPGSFTTYNGRTYFAADGAEGGGLGRPMGRRPARCS